MHTELWQQLDALEKQRIAIGAKCRFLIDPERFTVTFINKEFVVKLKERHIFAVGTDKQANFLEQLCILVYLINAKEIPLANRLVKAESLPGGEFFFRGPHLLPTEKLEKVFGEKPELLHDAGIKLGAKICDYGDTAIELLVLPRIPITFIIWGPDGEFGARSSILFDKTISQHLLLDALGTAVKLAIDALIK